MKNKHSILMVLLGWLIGAFFSPRDILSKFTQKAA